MKDLYKILGVKPSASEAEIKRSFRNLANAHHPDKNHGSKKSEEVFKEILDAYTVLSDIGQRFRYDEAIKKEFEYNQNKQKGEQVNKTPPKPSTNKSSKLMANTWIWVVGILILIYLYIHNQETETTTGNTKADIELKKTPTERPTSGEINF
jgi:curved DNA-binding protein CbpA